MAPGIGKPSKWAPYERLNSGTAWLREVRAQVDTLKPLQEGILYVLDGIAHTSMRDGYHSPV